MIAFDEAIEGRKKDVLLMAAIRELATKERVTRYKETIIDAMLADTKMTYQDASRFLAVTVNDDPGTREATYRGTNRTSKCLADRLRFF